MIDLAQVAHVYLTLSENLQVDAATEASQKSNTINSPFCQEGETIIIDTRNSFTCGQMGSIKSLYIKTVLLKKCIEIYYKIEILF